MKLLVTGGAGYIGSVMTAQLLAAGHEVTLFDNLSKGHVQAVPTRTHFVEGNLLDEELLKSVLTQGFDGVLHFAALSLVGESVQQPERYYRNNVCGTLNLLEAMCAAHVPRLVFSSTAAVYGEPEEIPIGVKLRKDEFSKQVTKSDSCEKRERKICLLSLLKGVNR